MAALSLHCPDKKNAEFFDFNEPVNQEGIAVNKRKYEISVSSIDIFSKEEFEGILRKRVTAAENGILNVFVHGYNTPFNFALARSAQIAYDTGITGPIFLFSWPGAVGKPNILQGISNVRGVERQLIEFLALLAAPQSVRHINIIAHSLGAKLVLDAVSNPPADVNSRPLFTVLRQIVFAAPLVDAASLKISAVALVRSIARITVFCSNDDGPLTVASQSMTEKIVGLCAGAQELELYTPEAKALDYQSDKVPVDLIDITKSADCLRVSFFSCSHARFAGNASILQDIALILANPQQNVHPLNRGGLYVWKIYNRRDAGLEFRK